MSIEAGGYVEREVDFLYNKGMCLKLKVGRRKGVLLTPSQVTQLLGHLKDVREGNCSAAAGTLVAKEPESFMAM